MEDKVITKTTVNGETYKLKDEDAARSGELSEEIVNRKAADNALSAELGQKQDALTEPQLQAVNSGINAEGVAQISTNTGAIQNLGEDVATIETKIPDQASAENQLADKSFVNSSVQTATANFRGNWANFAAVPTDATQYPADYAGSTTPTTNDYLVLQDASDFPVAEGEPALTGTWRLKYTGEWATAGKSGWTPEYQVNETPLTSDQLAALNSGITSAAVAKLNGIETGAEANTIDSISVNGATVTPDANKNVDLDIPDSAFVGTDGTTAGQAGLVPAPATTDAGKFLKADGTWDDAGSSVNVVQTTGTSTTDVMSQNAVTSVVFADPATRDSVVIGTGASAYSDIAAVNVIGKNAQATSEQAIAIGSGMQTQYSARATGRLAIAIGGATLASAKSAIALGDRARATVQGVMSINSGDGQGYNSSNYRLLTGLYDPQSAHDAATKGYVDGLVGNVASALNQINNGSGN